MAGFYSFLNQIVFLDCTIVQRHVINQIDDMHISHPKYGIFLLQKKGH